MHVSLLKLLSRANILLPNFYNLSPFHEQSNLSLITILKKFGLLFLTGILSYNTDWSGTSYTEQGRAGDENPCNLIVLCLGKIIENNSLS